MCAYTKKKNYVVTLHETQLSLKRTNSPKSTSTCIVRFCLNWNFKKIIFFFDEKKIQKNCNRKLYKYFIFTAVNINVIWLKSRKIHRGMFYIDRKGGERKLYRKEKVEPEICVCSQNKNSGNYLVLRKVTSIEGLKIDFLC